MEFDDADAAVPGAQRLRHERGAHRDRCARCGSTSTRRSSAAPRIERSAAPGPRPRRWTGSTRTWRSCTTHGWRSLLAVPLLREDRDRRGAGRAAHSARRASRDETCELLETFASQSARRPRQRPALPRARAAEPRARDRQPAQVGVPGEHVARAAHPAQRGDRVLRGPARADVRRPQRAPGGVPARHPRLGPAPARAAQRDPRPVQGRGRPDGARARPRSTLADGLDYGARRWCASAPPARHRACGSTSPATSAWSAPTSCGSSRCCSTC